MPSIIPGNTGPGPANRTTQPVRHEPNGPAATAETVGQLAGRTVRQAAPGDDLCGISPSTLHNALDRLNAVETGSDNGRRLSSRTVATATASARHQQAEMLSLRLSASACAGGAVFNTALERAGMQPELMSETQRVAIDAALAGIDTSRCALTVADAILRVALEVGARHVLRAGVESDGPPAVRAAVAAEVVNQASGAMARSDWSQAAQWLAEGAGALSADGDGALDADAVETALEGALQDAHAPTTAATDATASGRLTKVMGNSHILKEILQYSGNTDR